MKIIQQTAVSLMAIGTLFLPQEATAQVPTAALTAGLIIDRAQNAAEELIDTAFDRVDQSVLLAAMETRATIARTALEFENQREKTLEDFDGNQRRMLTDLLSLEGQINDDLTHFLDSIDTNTNKYVSSLNLLVSSVPGAIHIYPSIAFENEEDMDLTLKGVALSKLQIKNFRVKGKSIKPEFKTRDDKDAILRIPLEAQDQIEEPIAVPISFEVHKKKWLPWAKPDVRYYSTEGFLIPKTLGQISVTFVGETNVEKRETKTFGPFGTPRAKSSTFGKSRSVTRTWSATPDTGWKIDVPSAKYSFKLNHSGCSGSRSGASWVSTTDTIVRVRATGATDRKSGATCRTTTHISFDQVSTKDVRITKNSDKVTSEFGKKYTFNLSDFGSELKQARLAHVSISKAWGETEEIIVTPETPGPLQLEYNPASQIVYVTPQFN